MGRLYKLGITVLFSFMALTVLAQDSPFTWGVKTGITLNNSSIDADPIEQKTKVGFLLGVTVDYALTNNLYLQSGLSLLTRGAKVESDISIESYNVSGELKVNQIYLQLPITAAYKLPVTDNLKVVFNAGPYIAYGIGGKSKLKANIDIPILELNSSEEYDTFGDDALKRFDFGLTAGIGAEFKKIYLGANYDLGLINIINRSKTIETFFGSDVSYKNQGFVISVGYKF